MTITKNIKKKIDIHIGRYNMGFKLKFDQIELVHIFFLHIYYIYVLVLPRRQK